MSYAIHYGPNKPKYQKKKNGYIGFVGAVLIIMVCATAIGFAIPQQADQFVRALFPWTRSQIVSAILDLRENIIMGDPIYDAITTFCREIIYEAKEIQ